MIKYNKKIVKKMKTSSLYLLVMLIVILTAVFVFNSCNKTANEDENIGGYCSNGVEWQYADGILTLKGLDVFKECQCMACEIAIYNDHEELIKKINISDNKFKSVKTSCDLEDLEEYTLEISFFNEKNEAVSEVEVFDVINTEPDCVTSGYQLVYSHNENVKRIFNSQPALGHEYGTEIIVIEPQTIVECGYKESLCVRCGDTKTEVYYQDTNIARLCIYGDLIGIGKQNEIPVLLSFYGKGQSFDCYASLKYQGHSSLMYEKKNFTLKLFENEDRTQKYKIVFDNWDEENKYVLKANYNDPSACRNLVCAEIWSEMVACRDGNKLLAGASSTYGVTDGFSIVLYLNDEFYGLYTMTLHRDNDLFGMKNGVRDAIAVTNSSHTDESRFKAEASFDETSDWEVEFNGLEDDAWVKTKVNDLIDFVKNSSDEVFRKTLNKYLDVDSAIDYLIAVYVLGITDNASKNITMATYNAGPWIMSLCDMECGFGLMPFGTGLYPTDWCLPENNQGVWLSATDNLLWDRLLNNFDTEIITRYRELRESVLTQERIVRKVTDFISSVTAEIYEADAAAYPQMPYIDISAVEQIENYITERLLLLDEILVIEK